MKILVTGAAGMLGSALCPALRERGHDVMATDLAASAGGILPLDVRDCGALRRVVDSAHPDMVMHLAAATDVDRCEQQPAWAYENNAIGTEYVASACGAGGVRLLYVSTAGVFDGRKPTPYVETDTPNPVNVYGRSKLAGEFAVRHLAPTALIVRAGWMVGGFELDKKFAAKILRQLERQRELTVVTDKIGSPTFTVDLAQGIARLIETDHTGLFHMTNRGMCSRYEFACKLVECLGRRDVTITPIASDAFPLPAPRADSEAMHNERLESLGLNTMRTWEEALSDYIRAYLKGAKSCASCS